MGNPFYMFEADFAIDQVNQAIYSVKHMWANSAVFRTPRILKIDIATGTMTNLFLVRGRRTHADMRRDRVAMRAQCFAHIHPPVCVCASVLCLFVRFVCCCADGLDRS